MGSMCPTCRSRNGLKGHATIRACRALSPNAAVPSSAALGEPKATADVPAPWACPIIAIN
jgi:hypothetical protein